MTDLVLSLFPGIDLFGRGFEAEGYCVVRGPDVLWGGDIRRFSVPSGRFGGVIGGSPCIDWSKARRAPESGLSLEMLGHFLRVVRESECEWFVLENVPGVPSVVVEGYQVQRFDLLASEFGLRQRRARHFQFGSRRGGYLIIPRDYARGCDRCERAVTASEARQPDRRDWLAFCALMGVEPIVLPGMTVEAQYRAVGNGVPLPMGRAIASALRCWSAGRVAVPGCACGCGRVVTGRRSTAMPACRKRLERARLGYVTARGSVTDRGVTVPAVSLAVTGQAVTVRSLEPSLFGGVQ